MNSLIKKRLQHRCFTVNIPKVLGTAFFYRVTPAAAFELSFSIRKELKKTKWRDCLCFNQLV